MSIYLDASVVAPIFLLDAFNGQTRTFLQSNPIDMIVSDFVSAEFAAVVGRRLRMNILKAGEARAALVNLDNWTRVTAATTETVPMDVQVAKTMLHRLDLNLRAPDAVNLAITQRLGAELATFDIRMADCARALGIPVVAL